MQSVAKMELLNIARTPGSGRGEGSSRVQQDETHARSGAALALAQLRTGQGQTTGGVSAREQPATFAQMMLERDQAEPEKAGGVQAEAVSEPTAPETEQTRVVPQRSEKASSAGDTEFAVKGLEDGEVSDVAQSSKPVARQVQHAGKAQANAAPTSSVPLAGEGTLVAQQMPIVNAALTPAGAGSDSSREGMPAVLKAQPQNVSASLKGEGKVEDGQLLHGFSLEHAAGTTEGSASLAGALAPSEADAAADTAATRSQPGKVMEGTMSSGPIAAVEAAPPVHVGPQAGLQPMLTAASSHEAQTALEPQSGVKRDPAAQAWTAAEPQVLLSNAAVLEVGVRTDAHGWLRVRAELSQDGTVAAAMVANSTASAHGLRQQLPALASHLDGAHVSVAGLQVQVGSMAEPSRTGDGDSGRGGAAGHFGSEQRGQGDGRRSAERGETPVMVSSETQLRGSQAGLVDAVARAEAGSAGRLSVRV